MIRYTTNVMVDEQTKTFLQEWSLLFTVGQLVDELESYRGPILARTSPGASCRSRRLGSSYLPYSCCSYSTAFEKWTLTSCNEQQKSRSAESDRAEASFRDEPRRAPSTKRPQVAEKALDLSSSAKGKFSSEAIKVHTQHAQEVYELHLEPLEGFEAPSRSIWASRGPSFGGASS